MHHVSTVYLFAMILLGLSENADLFARHCISFSKAMLVKKRAH